LGAGPPPVACWAAQSAPLLCALTARKLDFTDVPVIDLAPAWSGGPAGRRAAADAIAQACGRVGLRWSFTTAAQAQPSALIEQRTRRFISQTIYALQCRSDQRMF